MWFLVALLPLIESCSNSDAIKSLENENKLFAQRIDALESTVQSLQGQLEQVESELVCQEGESICGCPAGKLTAPAWYEER